MRRHPAHPTERSLLTIFTPGEKHERVREEDLVTLGRPSQMNPSYYYPDLKLRF
jgi:hypothetical protein